MKLKERKIREGGEGGGGRWGLDEEIFADDLTGIGLSVEFWMLITRKKGDEIASGKLIGPEGREAAF